MGLLSSSASITRYRVEGELESPVVETVEKKLTQNILLEIDDDVSPKRPWDGHPSTNPTSPISRARPFRSANTSCFL